MVHLGWLKPNKLPNLSLIRVKWWYIYFHHSSSICAVPCLVKEIINHMLETHSTENVLESDKTGYRTLKMDARHSAPQRATSNAWIFALHCLQKKKRWGPILSPNSQNKTKMQYNFLLKMEEWSHLSQPAAPWVPREPEVLLDFGLLDLFAVHFKICCSAFF